MAKASSKVGKNGVANRVFSENGKAKHGKVKHEADEEPPVKVKGRAVTVKEPIQLPRLDRRIARITIAGDEPLIVHRMSEKAKKQMLEKQQNKASKGREIRDPHNEYRESLYVLPDGRYGFKAHAFKLSSVSACTSLKREIPMTLVRQAFHVKGEFIVIEGEPEMREDVVKIGMGTTMLRYRGEFKKWKTTLTIEYNARAMSLEQIVSLFELAGFGVGVGEWRPERNGMFGRFRIEKVEG